MDLSGKDVMCAQVHIWEVSAWIFYEVFYPNEHNGRCAPKKQVSLKNLNLFTEGFLKPTKSDISTSSKRPNIHNNLENSFNQACYTEITFMHLLHISVHTPNLSPAHPALTYSAPSLFLNFWNIWCYVKISTCHWIFYILMKCGIFLPGMQSIFFLNGMVSHPFNSSFWLIGNDNKERD